ncbi:MAG TPA: hypothetical protein V6C76_03470 [Drouetiella sp.]
MVAPNREVSNRTQTTDSTHGHSDDTQALNPSDIWKQAADERAARTSDRGQDVGRVSDRSGSSTSNETVVVHPNQLIKEAREAGQEMASLLQKGTPSDQQITVKAKDGSEVQMTAGQRVEQLRQTINDDCQKAIVASNELVKSKPNLDNDLNTLSANLQNAASKAGLDYHSPDFAQQAARNPELSAMLTQQQQLQSERMAPGTAMLTYAMMKAEGLTDKPADSMENFKQNGIPKPTQQEMTDAFLLVSQAGRTNNEVFHSPLYAATNSAIKTDYAVDQTEKGNQIVKLIQQADAASQSGSSTQAGELYKQAWQMGENIDQKFLAAQLKLQDNQSNPAVAQELVKTLANVKEARMHYAQYLVNNGDSASALPIALSVAADTPQFAEQDPTFNQLVSKATFGNSMTQGEFNAHQQKFATLMQDNNDPDRFSKAQTELQAMQTSYAQSKATMDAGRPKLDAEKQSIDGKLADLEKKKDSTDADEYKIEKARLEHEKDVINAVEKQNDQMARQGTYLKYLEGVLNRAQDNTDAAHACFEEVKKQDPELAKNPDLNLDALLEDTRHKGFFERNWHAIATGIAVVGGIAVGIGVGCLTGPGGVLAGVGTTGAILTALGAGAAVGAGAFVGTKGLAVGFDKVGWSDAGEGALIGALSATPVTKIGAALAPEGAGLGSLSLSSAGSGAWAKAAWYGKNGVLAANLGIPLGMASYSVYKDATHRPLDLSNPAESAQVANGWNDVNPSLFVPEQITPQQQQAQDRPRVQPKQLSADEIERRRNEAITDAPVGQ